MHFFPYCAYFHSQSLRFAFSHLQCRVRRSAATESQPWRRASHQLDYLPAAIILQIFNIYHINGKPHKAHMNAGTGKQQQRVKRRYVFSSHQAEKTPPNCIRNFYMQKGSVRRRPPRLPYCRPSRHKEAPLSAKHTCLSHIFQQEQQRRQKHNDKQCRKNEQHQWKHNLDRGAQRFCLCRLTAALPHIVRLIH